MIIDRAIARTLRVSHEMFVGPIIEKPNVKMVVIDEVSEVPADVYRAIAACAPVPDLVPAKAESLE